MNVCIPFSRKKVGRLVLCESCRSLDWALHGFEGQDDSGIFACVTGPVKVSAKSGPGQVCVGNSPSQKLCVCVKRRFCFPRSRTGVGWNLVGAF